MKPNEKEFFESPTESSQVKILVVTKYFQAWANVMLSVIKRSTRGAKVLGYLDLFAGPGKYEDGSLSTPIEVLKHAIGHDELKDRLVCVFNDRDPGHVEQLKENIAAIPGIETLKYQPKFFGVEVGAEVADMLQKNSNIPTFFFIDPFGYKGLSLDLIYAVLKDWGSDCVFFFNTRRIGAALFNPIFEEHMNGIFGAERVARLQEELKPLSPEERELTIIEEICQAIKDLGGEYVLPFCFKSAAGERTSHHLIFTSKAFLGYHIMKNIMAAESTDKQQGVASFEYNPATVRQPLLLSYQTPLDELAEMLLKDFSGRRLAMEEVYKEHSVGKPFTDKNYKAALIQLEKEKRIEVPLKHRAGTFGDKVVAVFPARERNDG